MTFAFTFGIGCLAGVSSATLRSRTSSPFRNCSADSKGQLYPPPFPVSRETWPLLPSILALARSQKSIFWHLKSVGLLSHLFNLFRRFFSHEYEPFIWQLSSLGFIFFNKKGKFIFGICTILWPCVTCSVFPPPSVQFFSGIYKETSPLYAFRRNDISPTFAEVSQFHYKSTQTLRTEI